MFHFAQGRAKEPAQPPKVVLSDHELRRLMGDRGFTTTHGGSWYRWEVCFPGTTTVDEIRSKSWPTTWDRETIIPSEVHKWTRRFKDIDELHSAGEEPRRPHPTETANTKRPRSRKRGRDFRP